MGVSNTIDENNNLRSNLQQQSVHKIRKHSLVKPYFKPMPNNNNSVTMDSRNRVPLPLPTNPNTHSLMGQIRAKMQENNKLTFENRAEDTDETIDLRMK